MSGDDENRFRPRPGRVRSDGARIGQAKSFLSKVRKVTRQHGGSVATPSCSGPVKAPRSSGRNAVLASGKGVKRGRGAAFVRARNLAGNWSHRQPGSRRVVVKQRAVQGAWKNGRAGAHLRYIQRGGTSRDGERGQLYSADEDRAEPQAFLDRGEGDRHQFRFIVSPEDGADLSDLTGYTRELMSQVETDLGTKLDWVAVNHHNTGHPHVHVVVRGKDDQGVDLVINGDYLVHGVRERASELATLELGPVTEIEQRRKLMAEIDQDRLTRIDRAMVEEAVCGFLDLRHEPDDLSGQSDLSMRLRRLGKLDDMGLATEHAPGVWKLHENLEPTLRDLGERGDILRAMQKALRVDGIERDPMTFQIHDAAPAMAITGRIVDKYLSNELGENLTLVVDGIDGRTHHVPGIDPAKVTDARIGSIVEMGPAITSRPADHAIATMTKDGIYRPSRHLEQARFDGRVPSGDYEGFVDAHVRRLESLRRAGITERINADQWRIPDDFEARAAAYDAGRNGSATVRILSTFDLEQQVAADGPTWLDRRLLGSAATDLSSAGFGDQVRDAMDRRRDMLIGRGDAIRHEDGAVRYRRNLIATLQEREVASAGEKLAANKPVPFRAAVDGESVTGTFTGTVQLSGGKFAIVEKSHEFTLVPWRPVIDRQLGREVNGIVQDGSVSWQIGRQRGMGI